MPFRHALVVLLTLAGLGACSEVPIQDAVHTPPEVAQIEPFWTSRALSVAERFELAKRSQPSLIAFLRRMPKGADLHNHLSGAGYSEYLLDTAVANELNYDLTTNLFTDEEIMPGQIVTIVDLRSRPEWVARYLNAFSVRGWHANTANGHDHFFSFFSRQKSADANNNALLVEVIKRNLYQNVQHLELMTTVAPCELTRQFVARLPDLDPGNLEGAYRTLRPLIEDPATGSTIRKFLDERDAYLKKYLPEEAWKQISGDESAMTVRYMPQLHRSDKPARFFANAAVAMTAINSDPRVVALNLVGAEDDPRAREQFEMQMKILDFLWIRMEKPAIALHAGELVLRESPVEPMRDRIRLSTERGHARRIGHGISVGWDNDVVGLLREMRERGILVEICLTSNESILGIQGDAHPFTLYRSAGVPVSISTDDEGVSRSNLTMEYVKAVERYGLSYAEVQELVRNSIEYSFLRGESLYLQRDYIRLRDGFEAVREPNWKPTPSASGLMSKHEKLRRQVRLERAFVEFEQSLSTGFTDRHP